MLLLNLLTAYLKDRNQPVLPVTTSGSNLTTAILRPLVLLAFINDSFEELTHHVSFKFVNCLYKRQKTKGPISGSNLTMAILRPLLFLVFINE